MQTTSRIPELPGTSYQSMDSWFKSMAEADLLFHPDDEPKDIVRIADGAAAFTEEECRTLNETLSVMFKHHGDEVYEAVYPYFMKTLEPVHP